MMRRLLDRIRPRTGVIVDDPHPMLLDDVLAAFQAEGWLTIWTLRDRLEERHPDVYGGWMADELRTALRTHAITAVKSATLDEQGIVRETLGVSRDTVLAAVLRSR
ncbi:hypothetical protein HS041_12445 [Planomonospora sp. ID67723]|uniref:hypothetical protein n=1 Tax=Planomonospora sp. ID67723 TaxID=2738134 RepID=UPI0018C41460|nr:hypothetical protein [Planomonospora sp. ID67723]MBG0828579.1 hypothetical protein [Planomonospora sp. ID67723]